ncbi:MAG: PqqD family protein [Caldilineaceae bacterium]|jgi:hypothetical protein
MTEKPTSQHLREFQPIRRTRQDRLVERQFFDDEIILYDLEREKFFGLNQTATEIWKECDGSKTVGEVAAPLARRNGISQEAAEDLVWLGINDFDRHHLLKRSSSNSPFVQHHLSRRDLLRRVSAIILLPTVVSISAPSPAQAISDGCARCCPRFRCYVPATNSCNNASPTGCRNQGGIECSC